MDVNAIQVELAFTFSRHLGRRDVAPSGIAMFVRVFDLTVRPALARSPRLWGRRRERMAIHRAVAQIARTAARLAGPRGRVTEKAVRQAADRVVHLTRRRLGLPPAPLVVSPFCFAYPWRERSERT